MTNPNPLNADQLDAALDAFTDRMQSFLLDTDFEVLHEWCDPNEAVTAALLEAVGPFEQGDEWIAACNQVAAAWDIQVGKRRYPDTDGIAPPMHSHFGEPPHPCPNCPPMVTFGDDNVPEPDLTMELDAWLEHIAPAVRHDVFTLAMAKLTYALENSETTLEPDGIYAEMLRTYHIESGDCTPGEVDRMEQATQQLAQAITDWVATSVMYRAEEAYKQAKVAAMNVQRVWAVPDNTVVGGYRALEADVCEDLGLDSTGRWG